MYDTFIYIYILHIYMCAMCIYIYNMTNTSGSELGVPHFWGNAPYLYPSKFDREIKLSPIEPLMLI